MAIPKKVNMVEVSKDELAQTSDSNLIAALAYAPIFQPIIPILTLLLKRDDQFVRFHSAQAIALFAVELIAGLLIAVMVFASYILGIILLVTTLIGWVILIPVVIIAGILGLLMFLLPFFMMYKAYKGETYKLPLLGNWAESFK